MISGVSVDTQRIESGVSLNTDHRPPATGHIDQAAKEFESVFLAQMLEHMFSDLEMGALADDHEGEEVYRSWMVKEYARVIADAGGIGVADHVKRELLKLQETGGEGA